MKDYQRLNGSGRLDIGQVLALKGYREVLILETVTYFYHRHHHRYTRVEWLTEFMPCKHFYSLRLTTDGFRSDPKSQPWSWGEA